MKLDEVNERIRKAGGARLVAVSKGQDVAAVDELLRAGHRVFGENRVQEAEGKFEALRASYPDLKLHLIGPLQTNKAKAALALFDVIESVDREDLVDALVKAGPGNVVFYVQVNTGEEPQKAGVAPKDLPSLLDYCRAKGLKISGLMCIPPVDRPVPPHFGFLAELARRHGLAEVSMGMSADYEMAIECGATQVRVGRALFGERLKSLAG
jgi:PLP dependent protein